MYGQQQKADRQDAASAKVYQPPRALISFVQPPRADSVAHKHGGRVGEAREEADDQTFQRAEHRRGSNRLLTLPAQHHVDDHVAHADQDLVHENREAFMEVGLQRRAVPAEMPAQLEKVGMLHSPGQDENRNHVHRRRNHRRQRRAAHAHLREAELSVNEHPV